MKTQNNIENKNRIKEKNLLMKIQGAKLPATANNLNIINSDASKKFDSRNNYFSVLKKEK